MMNMTMSCSVIRRTMRWSRGAGPALAVGVLTLGLLVGCDQQRIDKLEEGLSTEMDVLKQFGTPADIIREEDGTRTLEFPRQPEGRTNYFISIGPDGKMTALRQVLHPTYFAKVESGMDKADIRRLLGQAAKKQTYQLKNEEVWDWRWQDGQTPKIFSVIFDMDGKVLRSETTDDMTKAYSGG